MTRTKYAYQRHQQATPIKQREATLFINSVLSNPENLTIAYLNFISLNNFLFKIASFY